MYKIEPLSVREFLADTKMKLPRFQRRATWNAKQNFELCISIFQDYPVGVVIINKDKDSSWLLDGRQRRSALQIARENPVELYKWAKSYLRISATEDETEVRKKYWDRVAEYLQSENSDDDDKDYDDSDLEEYGGSFDKASMKQGLETLLSIILMVHQIRSGVSSWERVFNFKDYCFMLKYATKRNNYRVDPVELRKFLLELSDCQKDEISIDNFIDYLRDNIIDNKEQKFRDYLEKNWDQISSSLNTIKQSEEIFKEARIGVIELTNVSDLDAQNIFSRINSGGTQLKAEELLSAKPFWNVPINSSDNKLKLFVSDMYDALGVEVPSDMVRWDLGATLIRRIDDKQLLFERQDPKTINIDAIILGFKLISSRYQGGMSAKDVTDLEKNKSINWDSDISELIDDCNKICEILNNDEFFRYFTSWKKPISKMLGSAVVLEFIIILLKRWQDLDRPTTASAPFTQFKQEARILFDRLVYEYAAGAWRGSGDSKMARHIADYKSRVTIIDNNNWKLLIQGACNGVFNGQSMSRTNISPLLIYSYILERIVPDPDLDTKFDIDHIIPQKLFESSSDLIDQNLRDSLTNNAILPKHDNISKKDKRLNEITDNWLKNSISKYTGIDIKDFNKFSDLTQLNELKNMRLAKFEKLFTEERERRIINV